MEWLFALGALTLFVWLLSKFRGFRRAVAFLLVLAITGGIGWYFYAQEEERRLATLIRRDQVEFRDLRLTGERPYFRVEGTVRNNNPAHTLHSVKIMVRVFDCPDRDPVDWAQCETIGQQTTLTYQNVPPGQVRRVDASASFNGMPNLRQRLRWTYEILEVRAAE